MGGFSTFIKEIFEFKNFKTLLVKLLYIGLVRCWYGLYYQLPPLKPLEPRRSCEACMMCSMEAGITTSRSRWSRRRMFGIKGTPLRSFVQDVTLPLSSAIRGRAHWSFVRAAACGSTALVPSTQPLLLVTLRLTVRDLCIITYYHMYS